MEMQKGSSKLKVQRANDVTSAFPKKCLNILVFPGGTEIGLEIHRALSWCKNIKLFSASEDVSNHAPYVFSRNFKVSSVYNPVFVDEINRISSENDIDYIFPAHDDVLVALAQNQHRICSGIVSSPLHTCLITRSKSATYRFFLDTIPVPDQFTDLEKIEQFPVFVKPDKGQGSQHIRVIHDRDQLNQALKEHNEYIVLEYLPGEEYTIDCFSDRETGLLFCGGRQRIRTRSGISMDSKPVQEKVFVEYAQKISGKMVFHGAWFLQVKRDRFGTLKLMEIGPRIAGTMAVYRVLGVNFPLLSIYEQERIPVEIMTNHVGVQIDRALINRYRHQLSYRVIYVDFDDTLIVNGNVNTELIRFLYQCINEQKRIVLLTKHAGNLNEILKEHRLAGIFDEIIQLEQSANKSDYINESDAIMIDDSFKERKLVSEKLGILTFDCSMLEMLFDDRV
jgi:carbamoyl-phosphate synthase large subunit